MERTVANGIFLLGVLAMAWSWACLTFAKEVKGKKPNIVFILTDDLDLATFGKNSMPKTKRILADEGTTFNNMYVVSPLDCPSRASILSGKYVHNHGCFNNSHTGGCSNLEWQLVWENKAVSVLLKQQGYATFFAGQYLNAYGSENAGGIEHVPPGWDQWNGLVGDSIYYNYTLSVNGIAEKHGDDYEKDYLTRVIHMKAIDFLKNQTGRQPFFLMLSPPACHAPYTPAPLYKHSFAEASAPRTSQFNIHGKDKHWFVREKKSPMRKENVRYVDDLFRNRLRTLLTVDDMIEDICQRLREMGLLNDTYIFFTSDNGYHLGQFSLVSGKNQLYDFDTKVPFIVRGPGVSKGIRSERLLQSIDLSATFMDIAGGNFEDLDGLSFLDDLRRPETQSPSKSTCGKDSRHVALIEYVSERSRSVPGCPQYKNQWMNDCDLDCQCSDVWNNTFNCVVFRNQSVNFKYCVMDDWEDFVEVYDLANDHDELTNLAKTASPTLLTFLQEELKELMTCDGSFCRKRRTEQPCLSSR